MINIEFLIHMNHKGLRLSENDYVKNLQFWINSLFHQAIQDIFSRIRNALVRFSNNAFASGFC